MVDTLLLNLNKIRSKVAEMAIADSSKDYAVLTLHRPSNVDDRSTFEGIAKALKKIAEYVPIYFSIHPRTRKQIDRFGLEKYFEGNIKLMDPLGYIGFLGLCSKAKLVLTDSGGLQEETTVLDVPCLTIRENTERPVTVDKGTNVLVGTDGKRILEEAVNVFKGKRKKRKDIKYWDGNAAKRIVKVLSSSL